MPKRFAAIWFRFLTADQLAIRHPELLGKAYVLAAPQRGRMVIKAASIAAQQEGIIPGMVVADARAVMPALQVFDHVPERADKLLAALAEWSLRYSPVAAIDGEDGLLLDISGCAHLWGGERVYLEDILSRLKRAGYHVRAAIADTIGAAWAVSRYGKVRAVIEPQAQAEALLPLPPAALRLEPQILESMQKLGLYQIRTFISMPRTVLRRRFGNSVPHRIDQALGTAPELLTPVQPIAPFLERLPCPEPIRTRTGIEIALRKLLETLCIRLLQESKGLRQCCFKGYRTDGGTEQITIGTNQPVRNTEHLFRLFELKISSITPALGLDLFMLEAPVVEDLSVQQETLWLAADQNHTAVAGLLDRLAGKFGNQAIHRYLPDEHHWPERSIRLANTLQEKPGIAWPDHQPRPVCLLPEPEPIEVSVPIPDYPPMLFRYKGKVHKIRRADGPERIEREWWIEKGLQRDYYSVEDEEGSRYWVFRSGHYHEHRPEWFLHGFFA